MNASERQSVIRPPSKHFWITLSVSVVIVLVLFGTYVATTDCNGVKQAITMRKARRHIEAISPKILAALGRERVEMSDYTAGPCGSMLVRGTCASRQDAEALRSEIAATNPPVEVQFMLCVEEDGFEVPIQIEKIPLSK